MSVLSGKKMTRRGWGCLLAVTCALVGQACDQPAGFTSGRGAQYMRKGPPAEVEFTTDNPFLVGFIEPIRDISWIPQQVDSSELAAPLMMWNGNTVLLAEASRPIFRNFRDAGKVPSWNISYSRPNAASELRVPDLASWTVPWIGFPADCTNMAEPECAKYSDKTFPLAVGNFMLPDDPRPLYLEIAEYKRESWSQWQRTVRKKVSAYAFLSEDVLVVPVHVHVFVGPNGEIPQGYGSVTNYQWVADITDPPGVRAGYIQFPFNGTIVTGNIAQDAFPSTDGSLSLVEKLNVCGVDVQLESFETIRQSDGLEQHLVEVGPGRNGGDQCAYTRSGQDVFQYLNEAHSAVNRARSQGHQVRQGIHVFVGGDVGPENSGNRGLGCNYDYADQFGTVVALAEATDGQNAHIRYNIEHELQHVLRIDHEEESLFNDGAVRRDSSECRTVRGAAQTIMNL